MTKNEFDNLRLKNASIGSDIEASLKVIGKMPASNESVRAFELLENSTHALGRLAASAIDMAAEATANLAEVEKELAAARAKLEERDRKTSKADGKRSEAK